MRGGGGTTGVDENSEPSAVNAAHAGEVDDEHRWSSRERPADLLPELWRRSAIERARGMKHVTTLARALDETPSRGFHHSSDPPCTSNRPTDEIGGGTRQGGTQRAVSSA